MIIETDVDLADGTAWLAALDLRFAAALEMTGPIQLRQLEDGFDALLSAVVGQKFRRLQLQPFGCE